jgi:hypothetical protein
LMLILPNNTNPEYSDLTQGSPIRWRGVWRTLISTLP